MAGYLWWLRNSDAVQPGCHASGDCSYLWFSSWATWFGFPVSALALIPYGLLLLGTVLVGRTSSSEMGRKLLVCFAMFLLVMAGWFMVLQGVVLKQWCRLCLLSHALSVSSSLLVFIWAKAAGPSVNSNHWFPGKAAIAGLALGLAAIAGHSLGSQPSEAALFRVLPGIQIMKRLGPEEIQLFDQKVDLAHEVLPISGSPASGEVLVKLFDYTCPDCRRLHGQLRHLTAASPGRFFEVGLPAPLAKACNPEVKVDTPLHANACQLAQIACVVGRLKPKAFPAFHEWMMAGSEPPSLEAAFQRAQALLPGIDLVQAAQNRGNMRPLELGIQAFKDNAKSNHLEGLPLLMTEQATFLGAPENIDALSSLLR
jgi:uncharacterized membrane protein/protein-disulfide isomerase